MIYIIMCGGNYGENPKQLLQVRGECIVERTIRLLRKCGVNDIAISTNDDRFEWLGVPILKHDNDFTYGKREGKWLKAFYPTNQPVTYIFGDVYFSEAAIRKIVETETDSIMFFASAPPFKKEYIKRWAEPMAFKVMDPELFFEKVKECHRYDTEGRFGREAIAWELWQVIKGTPLNQILFNYTAIRDYSCDIDNESDARELEERLRGIEK